MADILQRLQQRKLVQWALAYIAASFALIQVLDVVAQRFAWLDSVERIFILALAIGFFVLLVLAWYHGERGVQRVSGTERLILALLLGIGGGLLWRFAPQSASAPATTQVVKGTDLPVVAIPQWPPSFTANCARKRSSTCASARTIGIAIWYWASPRLVWA